MTRTGTPAVTLADIHAAHERIRSGIYRSPCPPSVPLSDLTGCRIFCKLDLLQRTGSFKERGARNALLLLDASLVLFSQTCPLIAQSAETVDLYAEAFRKVWSNRSQLVELATRMDPSRYEPMVALCDPHDEFGLALPPERVFSLDSPGGATFLESKPLDRDLNLVVGQSAPSGWLWAGRDYQLEQSILGQLQYLLSR